MKILEPKYEILSQGEGMDGVYKQIELCGRTCYVSSMKIDKDSAKPFVERMVSSNHLAMCEHGTIYLHVAYDNDFFVPVVDPYKTGDCCALLYPYRLLPCDSAL